MKLSEFETLTYKELQAMDVDTLRKLVSDQGKKLNKRVSNIRYSSKTSKIAVNEVMESGGKFAVRGIKKGSKTEKSELIHEAKREQKFSKAKSGTVLGAIKQKQNIQKQTGKTASEYGKQKAKEYKKQETEKAKAKSKTGKLTKAQKKSITKKAKAVEVYEKKKYDKAVGDAWDVFHRWREEHPNVAYAKESVKAGVDEYVNESVTFDFDKSDMDIGLHDYLDFTVVSPEELPDVWKTVSTPEMPY